MGFFSSLFSSNLCDEKTLEYICKKMSKRIVVQSIASAHGLNYLAQYCAKVNKEYSYNSIIDDIYRHLDDINWYKECSRREKYIMPSDYEISYSSKSAFSITIIKFMYYYITRLPVILNGTTYSQQHFSKKEKETISTACFNGIMETPYHFSSYIMEDKPYRSLSRDFKMATKLSDEKDRMKFINDYNWFLEQPVGKKEILESIFYLNKNDSFLFQKILDEKFIIFYKGLQNYLADKCMFVLMAPDILLKK